MPTADEVLVSVGADFSEYNRNSEQATAAFEANMRDASEAAQASAAKAEAAVRQEAEAVVAARAKEIQANNEVARAAEQSAQRAQTSILSIIKMNDQLAASYAKLAAAAETAKRAREALNATPNTSGGSGGAGGGGGSGGGAIGAGFAGGNRGSLGGAGGISNISYQLQDFIVQVSSGQGVLRAFSQQAPQLLSGFGQWGAILGIAAAAVGVLGISLGAFETAADRAKEAQASFAAAMAASKGAFSETEQAALDGKDAVSLYEKGLLNAAIAVIKVAQAQESVKFEDIVGGAKGAASDVGSAIGAVYGRLAAASDGLVTKQMEDLGVFYEQFNNIIRQLNNPNISSKDFDNLVVQIDKLRPTADRLGFSFKDLDEKIATATISTSKHEASVEVLSAAQQRLTVIQTEAAASSDGASRAAENAGLRASGAAPQILALAHAMDIWADAATRGRSAGVQAGVDFDQQLAEVRAKTEAYKKGKDAVEAHADAVDADRLASAAADAARKQGLGSNDQRSAADEARAAVLQEAAAKRAYDAREKAAREAEAAAKRGAGAAAKHDEAVDKSNQKITEQIKLNERLIAVYHQGADAIDAARAQYDAENEARQRNIKVGTEEYRQFTEQRTADAETLRNSNRKLADYGKADAAVKAARNSQEEYNATLTQYNNWLAEGALTTEQYSALLTQLNDKQNGYAEGIQAIGEVINSGIQGANGFGDALLKITVQLVQLIAQAALLGSGPLSKVFDALAGTNGGLFNLNKGSGDALGGTRGLIGSIGTLAGSLISPAGKATGGQVRPGMGFPVGEKGTELFYPSVPGTIIPNDMIGGGKSGNDTVHLTQYINATGDKQVIAAASTAGRLAVEQSLNNAYKRVQTDSRRFGKG